VVVEMTDQRRVLVIEDDDRVRRVVVLMLDVAGYEVQTAQDGMDALAVLQRWRPDVILLDLMMPVMDGWAFRRAQLGDAHLATIPVVVLSAGYAPGPRATALAAAAVLPKPFRLAALLETVNHLTNRIAS
jgi:CheY-like chemotaxis protein